MNSWTTNVRYFEGDTKLLIIKYSTSQLPLAHAMRKEAFYGLSLSRLHSHTLAAKKKKGGLEKLSPADMHFWRDRMRNVASEGLFYTLYHLFARRALAPLFGQRISYSAHPEMRVHLAGQAACSAWHNDAEVTGRYDQVNVWFPLVDTSDSTCLWVETEYGKKDYRPVPVRYGEALIFDGSCLNHGTVANESDMSRVSFDFRFSVLNESPPKLFEKLIAFRPNTDECLNSCEVITRHEA
ncbi:hypothetical protein [Vibrio splendidus]|uniref:hypothetical protein n=1 Tax=Vibrio splendidus TaxID=29497 RepID=UPI00030F5F1B|nr:hypothetical protein [Vibrio splendidus]OED78187.1 hypothetical protein A144_22610 [Vibrio splendidus ZF-90]OEF21507.1 hypothetical protein A145_07315 [Vibrio splendidus 5S-101]PTP37177.1 hypothetical protein CWN95_02825 [Vibrio splendidus]